MSTITLRLVKGTPLTNQEVDDNFSNLNTDKYQAGASPDFVDTLTDKLSLDTAAAATPGVGELAWDDGDGTATLGLKGGNVNLQIGQENVVLVYNGTGSTISKGKVVAVSGAQGSRPSVVLADADSEALSAGVIGVATEDIANGAEGFVATFGMVRGVNTSGLVAGNPIYLSQTAGGFTQTRPAAPAHTVMLGWAIKINSSSGEIFLNISNGWELDELHNVLITSPQNNDVLTYESSSSTWKNKPVDADPAGTAVALAIALG